MIEEVKFIRKKVLIRMLGISATTLWRLVKAGKFPKQINLSSNIVAWHSDDIANWIENKCKDK